MEKVRYMISDAAALAGVETHVLRYWEEELDLTQLTRKICLRKKIAPFLPVLRTDTGLFTN